MAGKKSADFLTATCSFLFLNLLIPETFNNMIIQSAIPKYLMSMQIIVFVKIKQGKYAGFLYRKLIFIDNSLNYNLKMSSHF